MKHEFEFEYKAEVFEQHDVDEIVKSLVADRNYKKNNIIQKDVYFDNDQKELFVKGVFVRSRDENRLDIKYNPNLLDTSHTGADEYKCSLPLDALCHGRMTEFLSQFVSKDLCCTYESNSLKEQLGLKQFVVISKERTEYRCDDICIFIDIVDGLGKFIEVEVYSESQKELILSLFNSLSLKHLTTGYVELYLRKNDFKAYLRGRHLLEEDRQLIDKKG